jgi:hypothetical protein
VAYSKLFSLLALGVSAATLSSCSKGLSSDNLNDATNVTGGFFSSLQSSTSTTTQTTTLADENVAGQTEAIRLASGFQWLTRFKIDAELERLHRGGLPLTGGAQNVLSSQEGLVSTGSQALVIAACASPTPTPTPTATSTVSSSLGAVSCGETCTNSNQTLNVTCSASGSGTATCNNVAYTIANPSFGLTLDESALTQSGSTYSGSITVGFNLSMTVSGGSLSGGALACSMSFTIAANSTASSSNPFAPSSAGCGNLNCSYAGQSIDCTDLQTKINQGVTCK